MDKILDKNKSVEETLINEEIIFWLEGRLDKKVLDEVKKLGIEGKVRFALMMREFIPLKSIKLKRDKSY